MKMNDIVRGYYFNLAGKDFFLTVTNKFESHDESARRMLDLIILYLPIPFNDMIGLRKNTKLLRDIQRDMKPAILTRMNIEGYEFIEMRGKDFLFTYTMQSFNSYVVMR